MNLILITEDDFTGANCVTLRDRRHAHVLTCLHAKEGDEVRIGLVNGPCGTGKIVQLSDENVRIEVHLDQKPPAPLPVTLVLALPRPKMLKRALFSASSMGVKKICLINSYRVEKSFWKSPLLAQGSIAEYLMLGLEQARDTIIPEVHLKPLFKPFVEDELPGISENSLKLVAHPNADAECPRGVKEAVTLAIGPEGGFIPYEIEKFTSAGFAGVSMGERILRVEAAVPALLARLF